MKHIFAARVKEKHLDFQLEVAQDLPESLVLDSLRLRQILFNLVGNAVKFTGRGFVKVAAKCDHDGNAIFPGQRVTIVFQVQDSGIGIPTAQLDSIFKAFGSGGKLSGKYGGTGLGLAITRRLAAMMGGEITVDSIVGKGSTFTVVIKNIEVTAAMEEGEIPLPVDADAIRLGKSVILVVDDKQLNRRLLTRFLVRQDVDIIEAEDGKQALVLAKKHHPDLVLMDIAMPVMDGFEATRRIKADPQLKNIPVIFVTAYGNERAAEIEKAGGDGFLSKPISKLDIFAQLIRFLPYTNKENLGESTRESVTRVTGREYSHPEVKGQLPKLTAALKTEFLSRWETISKTYVLDEIEDFATDIKNLGATSRLPLLEEWGEELYNYVEAFDLRKVSMILEQYPGLVEEIAGIATED